MTDRAEDYEGAAGRAFVVQFLPVPESDRPGFRGRVERIASGESRRFSSPEELVAFMVQSLGIEPIGERKGER